MKKFNVVLEETITKVTTVVVEVEDGDKLDDILDKVDETANNSEDYISGLNGYLNVIEVIESDGDVTDFECSDYYKYTE